MISTIAIERIREACEAVCRIKAHAVKSPKLISATGRTVAIKMREVKEKLPSFQTIRINREDNTIIFYDLTWKVKGDKDYFSPVLFISDPAAKQDGVTLRIWVDSVGTAHITTGDGYKGTIIMVNPGELVEWIVEYLDEIN